MTKDVITSVIGSYPIHIDTTPVMQEYFHQKEITWEPYITSAVNDMINAGIHLISDGQTRDPFLHIFTRKLNGCRIRDRIEIVDKVTYREPITITDVQFVKTLLPPKKQLLGLLAGPITLSHSVVDLFYQDKKELAYDFAHALREEAMLLDDHVDMISIDEPIFSTTIPEYGKDLIDIIVKDLTCPTRLHVCGDISHTLNDIVEMPVDMLSHEFKATPKLFTIYEDISFPQQICLGSVRSDTPTVESVDEISDHIRTGVEVFGHKIGQIAPDCGLRFLPRENAFQKLHHLVMAGERVFG